MQSNIDKFQQALSLHQQGQLLAAEALYEDVLQAQPQHIDALHFLGVLKNQTGQAQLAVDFIGQSLKLYPNNVAAYSNMGLALHTLKRFEEAIASYNHALNLRPNNAEAYYNRGNALLALKRFEVAISSYESALVIRPDYLEALYNKGIALKELKRVDEAIVSYQRAFAIKPNYGEAHCNVINLLKDQGRLVDAENHLTTALSILPDNLELRFIQLIMTLPLVPKTAAMAALAPSEFDYALTDLSNWLASSVHHQENLAKSLLPLPFLLAYRVGNHVQRLSRYGDLVANLTPLAISSKPPQKKLRLVVVSDHFRCHSVWYVITRGLLVNLDRSRFELILYSLGTVEDQETIFAKSLADQWRDSDTVTNLEDWLTALSNDAPDIIFYPEIGMNIMSVRLAAHRIAPLQIASWGHPITTGLPTIDLYFSGELLESPNADSHYRERLIRLPNTGCCTTLIDITPVPLLELETEIRNHFQGVLFIIAQSIYKFEPADDGLYADIASIVPDSIFILLRDHDDWAMDQIVARLEQTFIDRGLNPQQHLLVIPRQSVEQFQSLLDLCDVYLDCPSFSGYTTAWQAVHRGIPIVTLEGEFMRQRLAAGLLRKIGITDTIASSREDYIQCAVKLAEESRHSKRYEARRYALKTAAPKADNDVSVVRAFEQSMIAALAERNNLNSGDI